MIKREENHQQKNSKNVSSIDHVKNILCWIFCSVFLRKQRRKKKNKKKTSPQPPSSSSSIQIKYTDVVTTCVNIVCLIMIIVFCTIHILFHIFVLRKRNNWEEKNVKRHTIYLGEKDSTLKGIVLDKTLEPHGKN